MDKEKKELFYDSMLQLNDLYNEVKSAIIYAEAFDPKREFYLAPQNQLRNALDHLFKAVESEKSVKEEAEKVREHLNRAGYDALEVLSGNVGGNIQEKMMPYQIGVISEIFPDYYRVLRPEITNIKSKITKLRTGPMGSKGTFSDYQGYIEALLDINSKVESMIPSLEDYSRREREEKERERKKRKKEKICDIILKFAIPLAAAVIGSVLALIISN